MASPAQVAQEVCGVQAQDLPAALLSIRARSAGLTASGVEQARQIERSIAWTWCLRGTLHLISAEDARWMVPLLGAGLIAAGRRRFEQLGWDDESVATGMRLLQDSLGVHGGLTRAEITQLLKANGLPWEGQAPVHLLYRATLEGLICMGPNRGTQPTYVLFERWLGEPLPLPRQAALEKITCRYLEAYGPARPQDLAGWSGLRIGEAREAWRLVADRLVQVEVAGQPAWLLKTRLPWMDELSESGPVVRLLPRFDTYLLGYANRDLAVDPAFAKRIHPGGGIIQAALLVDGEALGTWKTRRHGRHLEVTVAPFVGLSEQLFPQIEAEVADLGRFLGGEAVLIMKAPT